jgi:MoaA/NifB/PqqE/SkfB family radical SAM enzyme
MNSQAPVSRPAPSDPAPWDYTRLGSRSGHRVNGDKWMYHTGNWPAILQGAFDAVHPVSVHLAPTLRCNHRCLFCNYGQVKGDGASSYQQSDLHSLVRDMPLDLLFRSIDELAAAGVRSVMFTGGGDPTLYPHLVDGMRRCRERGLRFALSTNGRLLVGDLLAEIVSLEPTFIRFSLNAGTAATQRLVAGADDFETVLQNIEAAAVARAACGLPVDLSVGYVVDAVNCEEIPALVARLRGIEVRLARSGIPFDPALLVRPAVNYENGKYVSPLRLEAVAAHLRRQHGAADAQAFRQFMAGRAQYPWDIFQRAIADIEEIVIPALEAADSRVTVNYPIRRFVDLARDRTPQVDRCRSLAWMLFIWPDGTVYPCIEWAGTPGFEIGSLAESPLSEILSGSLRADRLEWINGEVLHTRCPATCARHDMNLRLVEIAGELAAGRSDEAAAILERNTRAPAPSGVEFI